MDKILESLLKNIADEENISFEEIEKILNLPYKQMRQHISALELNGKTGEDIDGLKTNFNMPSLFKLYLNKLKLNKLNTKEEKNELQN